MADTRRRFEGGLIAHLIRGVLMAIWSPTELAKMGDLSPYPAPESDLLREHKARWAARMFRVGTGG